jgi:hypothetical protein
MSQMLLPQRRRSTSSNSYKVTYDSHGLTSSPRGALHDLARGPTPGREIGLTAVPVEGSHRQDPTPASNEDPQIGQLRGLTYFAPLLIFSNFLQF